MQTILLNAHFPFCENLEITNGTTYNFMQKANHLGLYLL